MLKRYTASADNTIVNAFEPNLRTRATGANTGLADVLEVYSIYGRQYTGSQELSRILIKFPITDISADRTSGTVPASGSVSFYLRLFNAPTSKTVPKDFRLVANPMKSPWQEGVGLDLETYQDETKGNEGSNWMSASSTSSWNSVSGGADWLSSSADYRYEQLFRVGTENLEINITPLVERWIKGSGGGGIANYGIGIKLTSSQEAFGTASSGDAQSVQNIKDGATKSYYTKRFFARGTQYFYSRPVIEARWDSTTRDDRGNFFFSSSRAPAADNLNTLYFYNYVRGRLVNLPNVGTGLIRVSLYSGSLYNTHPSGSKLSLYDSKPNMTGGWVSTGIYSCSIGIDSSSHTTLYDVWHSQSAGGSTVTEYFTGSIIPSLFGGGSNHSLPSRVLNITNLQNKYRSDQTARLNLFVRDRNWSPNTYTRVVSSVRSTAIVSASYRVFRMLDGYEAVPYGTGSDFHTGLSYDVSGNYFDLDMNLLEPGYAYGLRFSFYDEELDSWEEQSETFKFRVENYEY
tara:strand:+ start:5801 stop:7348 length:1548 start_codon:yes stop_codon:yes gene_type:complete